MILDMAEFGLKPGSTEDIPSCPDASPFFERANGVGCTHVVLGHGAYRLRSPITPNFGIVGISASHTGIFKDFPSDDDRTAALNYVDNFGLELRRFSVASLKNSQRGGIGTGSLLAFRPTGGKQVSRFLIEGVELTSRAQWHEDPTKSQAFHKHGWYCDGSHGGVNAMIRGGVVNNLSCFGTELGGYAAYLKSVGGIRWSGGSVTWSAGRVATIRIDGQDDQQLFSGNSLISPDACMNIEVRNAKDFTFLIPGVWGKVTLEEGVEGITGIGNVRQGLFGSAWGDVNKKCKWL